MAGTRWNPLMSLFGEQQSPITGGPMYYPAGVSNPSPTVQPAPTTAAETMQNVMQQYNDPAMRGPGVNTVLGFTEGPAAIKAYHGSPHSFDAFNAQAGSSGNYGTAAYFHEAAEDAERYRHGGHVYETNLDLQKPFRMTDPVSAEDAARILREMGNDALAAKIEASGKSPFMRGSELWYWGMGQNVRQDAKTAALKRAGFDAVIGDPGKEIAGKSTRSNEIAVFDPARIEILRKYGLAPALAGGAAAAAAGGSSSASASPRNRLLLDDK
jgi:hypothetical protein